MTRGIFMNKHLFSSDLDGTLLNEYHELNQNTINDVRNIVHEGHYFVINTGRPYQGMLKFKKALNIDSPYVCDNGASIYWDHHEGFPIFFGIDQITAKAFFTEINDFISCALAFSHQTHLFQNRSKVPNWITHIDQDTIVKEGLIKDLIEGPISSIAIHIKNEDNQAFLKVATKYQKQIKIRLWGTYDDITAYDIYSVNASKGHAVKYLKDYLKINQGLTISFGDDLNDLELLRDSDRGVAMINAKQELKLQADDITIFPNDQNGVCLYIKDFLTKQN